MPIIRQHKSASFFGREWDQSAKRSAADARRCSRLAEPLLQRFQVPGIELFLEWIGSPRGQRRAAGLFCGPAEARGFERLLLVLEHFEQAIESFLGADF